MIKNILKLFRRPSDSAITRTIRIVAVAILLTPLAFNANVQSIHAYNSLTLLNTASASVSSVTLDQGSTADKLATIDVDLYGPVWSYTYDCTADGYSGIITRYLADSIDYVPSASGTSAGTLNAGSTYWVTFGNPGNNGSCQTPSDSSPATQTHKKMTATVDVSTVPSGTVVNVSLGFDAQPDVRQGLSGNGTNGRPFANASFTVQHPPQCTINVRGYWNNRMAVTTGATYAINPPVTTSGVDDGNASFTVPADGTVYQLVITDGNKTINAGAEGSWLSDPNGPSSASCNGGTTSQNIFVPYISEAQLKVQ